MLSLAEVDAELLMEDDSLVWTSKDVVIVLQHSNEKIPLRQESVKSISIKAILFRFIHLIYGLPISYTSRSLICS